MFALPFEGNLLNPAGKLSAEGLAAHQNHCSFLKTLLAEALTPQTCPVPTSFAGITVLLSNVRRVTWLTFGNIKIYCQSVYLKLVVFEDMARLL